MGSEGSDPLAPFYLVAVENEPVATKIDEALIRSRFGGTLFPPVGIEVEPIEELGHFWGDLMETVSDSEDADREEYLKPWRDLMGGFKKQSESTETAFVYVGDSNALMQLAEDTFPPGTLMTGSCLPRLVLGLTKKGSLCGVFGYVVQTQ